MQRWKLVLNGRMNWNEASIHPIANSYPKSAMLGGNAGDRRRWVFLRLAITGVTANLNDATVHRKRCDVAAKIAVRFG